MPSTVGTSTITGATYYSFQRKAFYASGRYWVFYSDGTNIVYRSSTDGSTWSDATTVRLGSSSSGISVWWDGTYINYCWANDTSPYYRRGTISGSTINWDSNEVTIESSTDCNLPSICKDQDGYPWVAYRRGGGASVYAVKASTTDGQSWGTPVLIASSLSYGIIEIVPFPSGDSRKVCVVYSSSLSIIKYKQYTSSWSSEENVSDYNRRQYHSTVIDSSGYVHVVYGRDTTWQIRYKRRTDSWQTEVLVQDSMADVMPPCLSINQSNGTLYCFWLGSPTTDHVYYKKCVGGTWDTDPTDWINETTDHFTGTNRNTCFYEVSGSYVGLVYMTKTSSPYNIRFNYSIANFISETLTDIIGELETSIRSISLFKVDIIGNLDNLSSYIKSVIKTLSDTIENLENLSSYVKAVVKTISDSIGQVESKIKYSSKFLSDVVGDVESKIKNVVKAIFSDKIGAKEALYFSRYIKEVFIEVLGMVESKTRIKKYLRIFIDKTGLKHKYNNLKNWYTKYFKERPRQRVARE